MLEVCDEGLSCGSPQRNPGEYEYATSLTTTATNTLADSIASSENFRRNLLAGEGARESDATLASHGSNHGGYQYNTRHRRVVINSSVAIRSRSARDLLGRHH